jgi:hypothetical protein
VAVRTVNGAEEVSRIPHGYGFTRGSSKMGNAGTGTVSDFGTPRHTAYPYRGVTGIHGFYGIAKVSLKIDYFVVISYISFKISACVTL